MGAARRELGKLDLDRRRDSLDESPAALWQRQKRLATFGERLATSSGQFRERTCDRLVHSVTGPRQARRRALAATVEEAGKRTSRKTASLSNGKRRPGLLMLSVSIPQDGPLSPGAAAKPTHNLKLRAASIRGSKIGQRKAVIPWRDLGLARNRAAGRRTEKPNDNPWARRYCELEEWAPGRRPLVGKLRDNPLERL